jgi:hypothetical protein
VGKNDKKIEDLSQEELIVLAKEQEVQIAALSKDKESLEAAVEDLSKKLTRAEKGEIYKHTVKVGTGKSAKEYAVLSGCSIKGTRYTAEELADNPEVCAKLIKENKQEGILKPLED